MKFIIFLIGKSMILIKYKEAQQSSKKTIYKKKNKDDIENKI